MRFDTWARRAALGLACALAGASTLAGAQSPRATTVSVAAAADLKFALDDVAAAFHASRPDVTVNVSFGSSGSLFAQLQSRAPFDLFFSADVDYARRLQADGLADGEVFVYAIGHLVLWVPAGSPIDVSNGLHALRDARVRKVALANPRHAPYGRAAEAALRGAGLYDELQPKLVYGENVAQAATFAQSGAADAGLIALSLALSPPLRDGRYSDVPLDLYPRLEQGMVVLKTARDLEAARALRAFVRAAEGRAILKRYGFAVPGE